MLKQLLYTSFFILITFQLSAQNCPDYANASTSNGVACGNQDYTLSVENTGCNGQVFFNVTGNYGSFGGEITWSVVSNLSGAVVASGGPGFNNGVINVSVGPLDPNVHGNIFELIVNDSWGDGLSGGGFVQTEQGGNVLANVNGNFGSEGTILFNANIVISPATITITTPSGPVTSTVNNCNDFNVQVPLSNTNYCTTINVNLPWTITCDVSGTTISSGTHTVVVDPSVPSDASDIVDIIWNTTSCSWEVSPQNDCDLLDVGNIFTISPDPASLSTDACGNGNENFTIDYLGVSGALNCCGSAGPPINITYEEVTTSNDAIAISSPFGGINNSALVNFPPNNAGGNATSMDLCVDVTGFCFDPPYSSTDESFYVIIFIDGNQVYMSPQLLGTSHSVCIDLTNVPGGYNESSDVEIYVLPNVFFVPDPFFFGPDEYTNYAPNSTCASLADGEWTAVIDATIDVVFDQMIGSPVNCSFTLTSPHTCCDPVLPTASNPAPISVDCATDVPAADPTVVTDEASMCATPPTVTFVSDVSDGNVCQGEQITRTYRIEDACGNETDVTQVITISASDPVFTLNGTNPSTCGGSDGEITIGGLDANTAYEITYSQNGTVVGPISVITNASGEYGITGLTGGNYTDFIVGLTSCSACESTNVTGVTINAGSAPTINAGTDQSLCIGSNATLTANNPDGATISWDNGVTDGVSFTPPIGTTTYTVTADLAGCTATDVVDITVNPLPTPTIDAVADQCESETSVTLIGNPSGGIFSGTAVSAGVFNPSVAGVGTHTLSYEFTDGNGCSNTTTANVEVIAGPTFTLSATDPSSCLLTDGSISIDGLEFNTAYQITYEDANGNTVGPISYTSSATGNILINNLPGGNYTGFVVDLNGCSNSDNSILNLVAPGSPTVDAGQDIEVCEGEVVTLTASNPDGAVISWDNSVADGVAFSPPNGTTNYTVSADLVGCISTDVVTVTVVPNPTVNAGNDITVCEGEQIILTGTGAVNYTWDNGVVDGQPFTPPPGTTTYIVTGTNAGGCAGTDEMTVTVASALSVSFAADETEGCSPLNVNFTNTSASAGTCTYTLSNGVVLTGCNPSYTFAESGCYDVTLTVENSQGCLSLVTETDMVCVDAPPVANFVANPGSLGGLTNTINFNNTSLGGDTYVWFFGDDELSNEVNPSHEYNLESEEYIVTLIAISELGCADTISAVIPVEEELIYYVPNTFTPDGNNVNQNFKPIFTSGFDPMDYHLTIFNRWGERVFESFNSAYGWDGTYGTNGEGVVQEGTYVWKIEFKTNINDERKEAVGHVNVLR